VAVVFAATFKFYDAAVGGNLLDLRSGVAFTSVKTP
jgi:hypothetical protein